MCIHIYRATANAATATAPAAEKPILFMLAAPVKAGAVAEAVELPEAEAELDMAAEEEAAVLEAAAEEVAVADAVLDGAAVVVPEGEEEEEEPEEQEASFLALE